MVVLRVLGVWGVALWLLSSGAWAQSARDHGDTQLLSGSVKRIGEDYAAGPEGARLALRGGSKIVLYPSTRLSLHGSTQLVLSAGPSRTRGQVVELKSGRVDVVVPSASPPKTAVLVQSLHDLSSITKGGRSTTLIEGNRVTTAARDSEMLVGIDNRWRTLKAGLAKTVGPALPRGEVRPLPEIPPQPVAERSVVLSDGTGTASVSAGWRATPHARSYQVELAPPGGRRGKTYQRRGKEPKVTFSDVEPGVYEMRVRVVDDRGLESEFSKPEHVRVLGLRLPEGAVFDGRQTIFLPPKGGVRLLGAHGLKISYGPLERFVNVPERLSLARERGIAVVLKDPESNLRLPFRLEPLVVEATIHFGAKGGHWPKKELPVEIRLSAPGQSRLPRMVHVSTKVTVNLRAIPVRWRRAGNRLTASVPRPAGDGPWVIRVDVIDEFGNSVGRNVVELGT